MRRRYFAATVIAALLAAAILLNSNWLLALALVRHSTITGTITEPDHRTPVRGAIVIVDAISWGLRGQKLIWDARDADSTRTDSRGRFRLRYKSDGYARLTVIAEGHAACWVPLRGEFTARAIELDLPSIDADAREVIGRNLPIHLRAAAPVHASWDLLGGMADKEHDGESERDLTIAYPCGPDSLLVLTAFGQGGVAFNPARESDSSPDLGCMSCLAPDDGYKMTIRMRPQDAHGLCFIRTRDGRHYARAELPLDRMEDLRVSGDAEGVRFCRVWMNRSGGLTVCSERPVYQ